MAQKIEETEEKAEKKVEKKKGKPEVKLRDTGQMVRILGTDLNGSKKMLAGLACIKGVGHNFANAMIVKLKLDKKKKLADLTDGEITVIENAITNPASIGIPTWMFNRRKDLDSGKDIHVNTTDLIVAKKLDIDLMGEIKSYKGLRHARGQKVRGQRTASTGRGRIAVGVQKKRSLAAQAAAKATDKKEDKKDKK